MTGDAVAGADGLLRCPWSLSPPELTDYHDREWGRPVRSVTGLFERLTLEAFQSGLSWLTILRKRDNFRTAFAGFDPERVAAFGPADVERLLGDAGIVRNRAKIEASVHNAGVVAAMGPDFADLVWTFADRERPRPALADWRATSPGSVALARALKQRGIRFFGPTTAYAMMQATGLVDDHVADCHVPRAPGRTARRPE